MRFVLPLPSPNTWSPWRHIGPTALTITLRLENPHPVPVRVEVGRRERGEVVVLEQLVVPAASMRQVSVAEGELGAGTVVRVWQPRGWH